MSSMCPGRERNFRSGSPNFWGESKVQSLYEVTYFAGSRKPVPQEWLGPMAFYPLARLGSPGKELLGFEPWS